MTGGNNSKPQRSPSSPTLALAVLAVVGLVAASLAPVVGVAFADSGAPADVPAPTAGATASNLPNETGEATTDSASDRPTADSVSERNSTSRTPSNETRKPGRDTTTAPGSKPPTRGANESSSPDRATGREPPTPGEKPNAADRGNAGPPDRSDAGPNTGPPEDREVPPESRESPPTNGTRGSDEATERGRPGPGIGPTVSVTVENASANEPVAVNVSSPGTRSRNVSFSTLELTPTRNASFTLNVTESDRAIPDETPTERLSNGTEPLAFLSVDHSISDRNISSVNFTFRLRKERTNATERDDIALYRYHDEAWNELPTTLVETTESHYVYRVRSPGLSEFAAGRKRPNFEITNATVDRSNLSVGDTLEVQVRVENEGEADGAFTAELVLDDESVARRHLTIAAGGMRQTTFERTVSDPGTYEVSVNEFRVGNVSVNETGESAVDGETSAGPTDGAATDREQTDADLRSVSEAAGVPGFGVGVTLAAAFGSLLVARWRG